MRCIASCTRVGAGLDAVEVQTVAAGPQQYLTMKRRGNVQQPLGKRTTCAFVMHQGAKHGHTVCTRRRHTSSVTANPVPSAFVRLGSFVRRLGPEPPATRLASYVQRLRGYGFDCSPILRKFVACGAALTEDMVRLSVR